MVFADLQLARRLERTEGLSGASFVEARRKISPRTGAEWEDIGGAIAIFDGPDSPVTQTFGLGLFQEAGEPDLARLEDFFRSRGAGISHEVSPLAGVPLAQLLNSRGYRPIEFTDVMYRNPQRDAEETPGLNPKVTVRLMEKGEEELWSQVSARGWAQEPEVIEFIAGFGQILAARDESLVFFGDLEGEPIATGVLHTRDGVALLGGACTVPEARRQGAQKALFDARMRMAVDLGCELVMICAHPGTSSHRNAERQDFRTAYTRTKWHLAL